MKRYAYYPGCSSDATAAGLGHSAQAIARALDIEFIEVEDWTCCGTTPYGSLDYVEGIAVASRNLALAEKTGLELVTPCSSCFVTLSRAAAHIKEHPKLKETIDQALAAADLKYTGTVRVRLLLEVLVNDITPEVIAARVKRRLEGLKVAAYYGCQEARPKFGFDNPEQPTNLDRLVASLGATTVPFPLKNHCCGGALIISEEDLGLELMNKLLASAMANGAQCIATICPLCQTNLDAYQGRVNRRFKTDYKLPVLFVTQLMGIAFGIENKTLGLNTNIVSLNDVMNQIYNPVAYATTH
jgi:heterodisulfide reductase subunit B